MASQGDLRGYEFCRKNATIIPGTATIASARASVVNVSPSTCTVSLSKKRRKKWSTSVRKTRFRSVIAHLHHIHHVACDLLGVGLLHQLREHAFKRWQRHQLGEIARRGVGNLLALRQHNHAIADTLDRL